MSDPPDTNPTEARRWLQQAREELLAARRLAADSDLPPRIACFLAHLAAEKALKAWLIWLDRPFRKVHDLRELFALLSDGPNLALDEGALDLLNPWVIEGRYPGDVPDATQSDATECVEAAELVVRTVLVAISDVADREPSAAEEEG